MDQNKTPEAAVRFAVFLKETNRSVKKIFLFGSYAKGTFHDNSDIDLAIIFDRLADSFDMQVELMKLKRKFDNRIEPHPFVESEFNLSHPFAREIIYNGIEIV